MLVKMTAHGNERVVLMLKRMTPIPIDSLLRWIFSDRGSVFGVPCRFHAKKGKVLPFFSETIEVPLGPAAGPHTQLAQNIAAAYVAGARFFELKTVQMLDGDDLPVAKPCILASDACYNVEWSTELTVQDAFVEYVKGWFILKLLAKELSLGSEAGFVFNMSVGYDLAGIQSNKINIFIEGLKNASKTAIWAECMQAAKANLHLFRHVDASYLAHISPQVSHSITLSTLHGCPPDEIERIANYLLTEKGLHTYIKCNPTLLGYEVARGRLDAAGYANVIFDDHHFQNDLQYNDAIPMLQRLQAKAEEKHLSFGVKLSNTLPVRITAGELPGDEMYLSGPPLYLLTTALCARLAADFGGNLPISYAGGADAMNIAALFAAGIRPITVAATLLKPGGYTRLTQMAEILSALPYPSGNKVNVDAITRVAAEVLQDTRYQNSIKPKPSRKYPPKVPLLSCFQAPCRHACPIRQDIPTYVKLVGEGKYVEALRVITERNPLPFLTGTLCNHACQGHCRRGYYEEAIHIRSVKLLVAERAMDALIEETVQMQSDRNKVSAGDILLQANQRSQIPNQYNESKKVAIVGGGPAGLAAAYFLARAGFSPTLFEKTNALGGLVRHVIPPFRIADAAIDQDIALLVAMGADIRLGMEITSLATLRRQGYGDIIVAVGAPVHSRLRLEVGDISTLASMGLLSDTNASADVGVSFSPRTLPANDAWNAIDFLAAYKKKPDAIALGKNVVVIGGGNVAIDAARAAKRVAGVQSVTVVYRRDVRSMPAAEEELQTLHAEGIPIAPLRTPMRHENGQLICQVNALGDVDASGRYSPVATGGTVSLAADTVIAAIGEKVDEALYASMGVDENTWIIGDGRKGPATIVQAIADAREATDAIIGKKSLLKTASIPDAEGLPPTTIKQNGQDDHAMFQPSEHNEDSSTKTQYDEECTLSEILYKRASLLSYQSVENETHRCLSCDTFCACCVDVCPNRANVSIIVQGAPQILHIDRLCNACGNCAAFCPYDSAPYADKFTLFHTQAEYAQSEASGMLVLDVGTRQVLVRADVDVTALVDAILDGYAYLL